MLFQGVGRCFHGHKTIFGSRANVIRYFFFPFKADLKLRQGTKIQPLLQPLFLHQVHMRRWGKVSDTLIPLLDHHLWDMSTAWRTKDIPWKSLVESTTKHLMESSWSWRAAHSIRYRSKIPMPMVRIRTLAQLLHRKDKYGTYLTRLDDYGRWIVYVVMRCVSNFKLMLQNNVFLCHISLQQVIPYVTMFLVVQCLV